MSAVAADTHSLIWYLFEPILLSANALQAMQQAVQARQPIYVPTICVVEIIYLVEKGKLPPATLPRLYQALDHPNSDLRAVGLEPFIARTIEQIPRSVVPDMPDRIIAATALHLQLPLITRDAKIQASQITTIW